MEIEELIAKIESLISKANPLHDEVLNLENLLNDFRVMIFNLNDVNALKSGYNYFLKWREIDNLAVSTKSALDSSIRLIEKHIKKFDLGTLVYNGIYNINENDSLYDKYFDPDTHLVLKTCLKENIDKTSKLDNWTKKDVVKSMFLPGTCFEYNNPDSNHSYILHYKDSYIRNEKYNFKWLIINYFREHPNKNEINIAVAGGGNFFEIFAINQVIQEQHIDKLVNVYVFDKTIWNENVYSPEITTHINKIELFKGDFFEVLRREELPTIDIYIFARCLVYGELFQTNNMKTDEEGQKRFCEKVAELMEFLLQFDVQIVALQCELGELTSAFNSKLLNFLNDCPCLSVSEPNPNRIICPTRESRMYYITKRNA